MEGRNTALAEGSGGAAGEAAPAEDADNSRVEVPNRCPHCGSFRKPPTGNPIGRPRQELKERSFGAWVLHIYAPSRDDGRAIKALFRSDPWGDRPMRVNYVFTLRDWLIKHGYDAKRAKTLADTIWGNYKDYKKRIKEMNRDRSDVGPAVPSVVARD